MIHKLRALQASGQRLRVGVIGCGAMGLGVAWQVARTPGMEVVFLGDIAREPLAKGAASVEKEGVWYAGGPIPDRKENQIILAETGDAALHLARNYEIDCLVECTNAIYEAARYGLAAIEQGAHLVLMNAEVDLVFGTLLAHEARKQGVVVTSDAGDQHGVLATMIDEIQLWGFKIVQAGNMKGFLNRYACAATAQEWADKQKLSVVQTVSYTDGTKMNIEQALIGNYAGLTPLIPGMEGPRCSDVREVMEKFDFTKYGDQGRIDYTVGVPFPGGGVYVVGYCDDAQQDFLLKYYKVTGSQPYYLFFRPYHLCHVETPRAIAQAYFDKRPVISPPLGRKLNDVYAYAKTDLAANTTIHHAIGGDEVYGLVDAAANAEPHEAVPVWMLEPIQGERSVLTKAMKKDERLRRSDLVIPDTPYHRLLAAQDELSRLG